jgi:hypothetical protein
MSHMLSVTPVDTHVAILVGVHAIRKVEDSTYTPEPVDPAKPAKASKSDKGDKGDKGADAAAPVAVTTEPLLTPPVSLMPPVPVAQSTITFIDGSTLVVVESLMSISAMASAP